MKTINILLIGLLFFAFQAKVQAQTQGCNPSKVNITITNQPVEDLPPILDPPPPYFPPDPNFEGDRIIFFVHGLGGGPESWVKAASATQAGVNYTSNWKPRKAYCLRPTYTEFTLRDAGVNLHNDMYNLGWVINKAFKTEPKDNYIIAHSQGGLVSRMTDKLLADGDLPEEDRMFGGIVTFGTPHLGARIINNTDPNGANLAGKFANEACEELGAGPLRRITEKNFFLDLFTSRNLVEKFCQHYVVLLVIRLFLSFFRIILQV
ncbi:MAG: hypothetical protein R2879_13415 [Saprospiraceae bacterium]